MTRAQMEVMTLVGQLDRALEEDAAEYGRLHWHSLIRNLSTVRPEDWDAVPPGGGRTIRELVMHIGKVYLSYASCGFGDGSRDWSDTAIDGLEPGTTPEEVTRWLRATHAEFRNAVAALQDDQLDQQGMSFDDGPPWTTRRVVEVMIQHSFYHAGEINHLRAMLQGNDDWNHQDIGREDATW
jgi:uncharacterized damage-inducible protein DinB